METLYRKVAVSERLPSKQGNYICKINDRNLVCQQILYLEEPFIQHWNYQVEYWFEEIPDPTAQLQADKAELLEALEKIFKIGYKPYRNTRNEELEIIDTARNMLNKFQKHKQ